MRRRERGRAPRQKEKENAMSQARSQQNSNHKKAAKAVEGLRGGQDAVGLLTEDHEKAMELFDRFEGVKDSGSDEERAMVAGRVCEALLTHMALEEELFYPRLNEALDEEEMIIEAELEHRSAREIIKDIGRMEGSDARLGPAMKVLREQIEHHVKEEESEMFPKARASGVDLMGLGDELREAMVEMAANQAGSDSFDATRH